MGSRGHKGQVHKDTPVKSKKKVDIIGNKRAQLDMGLSYLGPVESNGWKLLCWGLVIIQGAQAG